MTIKLTQLLCDEYVSFDHFNGFAEICTPELIRKKLEIIINAFPNKRIYLGITHHLCGRYTGNYDLPPLPTKYQRFYYQYKTDPEMLTEEAHSILYEKMFPICVTKNPESIRKMEISAISSGRELASSINLSSGKETNKVANDTDGGNGRLSVSDYYFLYACISRSDIL